MSFILGLNDITYNDSTTESDVGIGQGTQTWQDFTSTRTFNTTYTNTTALPIVVSVICHMNGNTPPQTADYADVYIDGTARARVGCTNNGWQGSNLFQQTFLVKPGSTYSVTRIVSEAQYPLYLDAWTELR